MSSVSLSKDLGRLPFFCEGPEGCCVLSWVQCMCEIDHGTALGPCSTRHMTPTSLGGMLLYVMHCGLLLPRALSLPLDLSTRPQQGSIVLCIGALVL